MMSRVLSACPLGVEAIPISVEVDVRSDRLKVSIVGLPDAATRESKDRLIPAITNSGFALQSDEITINLSPADVRKEGTSYDLPMAVGILVAKGIVGHEAVADALFLGELALDGTVRPVRAVLASAECARAAGAHTVFVPRGNGFEASLIEELRVFEVDSFASLVQFLRGRGTLEPWIQGEHGPCLVENAEQPDMSEVKGHAGVKRVLEIAAAGNHNVLMFGPPGSGKSMLSKRLPGILPAMSTDEIIEVTRIYSSAGKLTNDSGPVRTRPFRSPHHTASPIAMIGGGSVPKPGEVTLAHRGVLFLDEFPEFPRPVLEVLRQPLEDLEVTVSRAHQQITFPADFLLVAAMNPCPCGWMGDPRRRCQCSASKVAGYRSRISGPLLDRIDLHVEVPVVSPSVQRKLPPTERSRQILERISRTRRIQIERFQSSLKRNGNMTPAEIQRHCRLDEGLTRLLEEKVEQMGYSSRVHAKILKLARTIADLAQKDTIESDHILEALGYRRLDVYAKVHRLQEIEEVHP